MSSFTFKKRDPEGVERCSEMTVHPVIKNYIGDSSTKYNNNKLV